MVRGEAVMAPQILHCTSGLACASRPLALRLQRRPVIAGRAQESFAPERSFWRDMMVLTWSIRTYLTTIQTCMGPVGLQMHRLIPCLLCQVRGRGPHRAGTRGDLASRATACIAPADGSLASAGSVSGPVGGKEGKASCCGSTRKARRARSSPRSPTSTPGRWPPAVVREHTALHQNVGPIAV